MRPISMEEVALHNKAHDGWMVLHGKVYNIGPYLHYHPGGVDILKPTLGRDATALFEKYHRWVGIENLIGKLLLGYVEEQQQSEMSMPPPRARPTKEGNLLKSEESADEDEEEDVNPWENKS